MAPPLMLSLSKVVTSEPATAPVPVPPPPVRVAAGADVKPSCENTAFELLSVITRLFAVPVFRVISPGVPDVLMVLGLEVLPLIVSMAPSRVPRVAPGGVPVVGSLTLMVEGPPPVNEVEVATVLEKLITDPSTVMESPAMLVGSVLSAVEVVIA